MRRLAFLILFLAAQGATAADAPSVSTLITSQRFGTYLAGGRGLYASLEEWKRDVERASALGIGMVRFNADMWDVLEPEKGRYDWKSLDAVVQTVTAKRMRLLFTLPIASRWNAAPKAQAPITHWPTPDRESLRRLAEALARRYRGRIAHFEIWNEPDYAPFWKGRPDAAEYLDLLKEVYPAIKTGNPQAVVLLGGLAVPTDTAWLDAFLRLGGGRYFDAMNIHVYPASGTLDQDLSRVRDALRRYGLQRPIWITEMSTTGLYFESPDRKREEHGKALFLVKNYVRALSEGDVACVFWHTLRNPGRDIGLARDFDFGLMTAEGTPLPAHQALKTLSQTLLGSVPKGLQPADTSGLKIYRFDKKNVRILVLWSENGQAAFKIPWPFRQAGKMSWSGESHDVEKEKAGLSVGPEPMYLLLKR